jgi:K+-sensing histidine kinase KdpD
MRINKYPGKGNRTELKNGKRFSVHEESWWARHWLLVSGTLILVLSFAAMATIWKNLQDMEAKRYREHDALARSIGETVQTFLKNRQYDYLVDNLRLLQKSPFIAKMVVTIEGRVAFESGILNDPKAFGPQPGIGARWFPYSQQIRKTLANQNGKRSEILITYSMEEFRRPKLNILAAFALVIILLVCLGGTGYRLHAIHQKLVLAEKTKVHMIYGITHDAKQDLSVIQGKMSSSLHKLQKGLNPTSLEKDMRLTMESADAIERYLNNLKDQQGLSEGRIEIMREPVQLQDSIYSAAEAFSEKMAIRNMSIQIGVLEKKRKVWADVQIVKRVLMNLIHNAMKYSPSGGLVSIWQENREASLDTYVRDQGQGIPSQEWQRIFQPYVQLDAKKDGMGLGLATARQLVVLLNGRLEVAESVVGRGTTMRLTLPWAQGK